MERTTGDPQRETEALYWKAVVAFEISGDRDDLIAGWETLLDRFHDSEWAQKTSYVRG